MITSYDYLIVGTPDEPETEDIISQYAQTHHPVYKAQCYKDIKFSTSYPFINIRLAPCVWILQLSENSDLK